MSIELWILAVVVLAGWYTCWRLASGWFYAELQRKYPTIAESDAKQDWLNARGLALAGPIAVAVVFLAVTREHGRMRPGQEDWR